MKYRKRPVEVEAIRWTGSNIKEVKKFVKCPKDFGFLDGAFKMLTEEGVIEVREGEYIVREANGEYVRVKPETFVEEYDEC